MSFQTYTISHKGHCTSALNEEMTLIAELLMGIFSCRISTHLYSLISHLVQILSIAPFFFFFLPKWSSLILSTVSLNMGNESGVKMIPDCLLSSLGWGGAGERLKCQTSPPNKQTTTIKHPTGWTNTGSWWKQVYWQFEIVKTSLYLLDNSGLSWDSPEFLDY